MNGNLCPKCSGSRMPHAKCTCGHKAEKPPPEPQEADTPIEDQPEEPLLDNVTETACETESGGQESKPLYQFWPWTELSGATFKKGE